MPACSTALPPLTYPRAMLTSMLLLLPALQQPPPIPPGHQPPGVPAAAGVPARQRHLRHAACCAAAGGNSSQAARNRGPQFCNGGGTPALQGCSATLSRPSPYYCTSLQAAADAVFAGVLVGYVTYDLIHWAVHRSVAVLAVLTAGSD